MLENRSNKKLKYVKNYHRWNYLKTTITVYDNDKFNKSIFFK